MRLSVGIRVMKKNIAWSGRDTVDAVRRDVENDSDWDVAESADRLHFYLLRASQNVGRFEPFSADEVALNTYLADRMAGKRLCDYAWRMFAQSR